MRLRKVGQNPLIGSGDRVQTRSYVDADGIRTKSNVSPPLPLRLGGHNHPKIRPKIQTMWLYHKVMCPKDADRMANSLDPDQTGPLGAV